MTKRIAIQLKDVSKTFKIRTKTFLTLKDRLVNFYKKNDVKTVKALKNINLDIYEGEIFGIVGRNGSGKSTLTKIMSGAFVHDRGGEVIKKGTSLLMNLGVGFSHELTARENIYVNGSTLGLRIKQIDTLLWEIIKFAELEEFIDTKIKYFSTGMIQRLSFSIAVYAKADIIFLDEVFAVGDAVFREKAVKVLESSWLKGRTVVMVTHNLGQIEKYCHRAVVLDKGNQLFLGKADEAISFYKSLYQG